MILRQIFLMSYRFLFLPIVSTGFLLSMIFSQKSRAIFKLRQNSNVRPVDDNQPIWIHAASGEFEYAKPLITQIKKDSPQQRILVSYFSSSFEKQIKSFPGVDYAVPLPFDFPGSIRTFLGRWKPKLLLIARTDLWPELLNQVHGKKIPTVLFSARHSGRSALSRFTQKIILQMVDHVLTVSEADKEYFSSIHPSVLNMGETRFDQVLIRVRHPKPVKDALFSGISNHCVVAGSTWSDDEDVLFKALSTDLRSGKKSLVIAPHEPTPDHLAKLESTCAKNKLKCQRYSLATSWSGEGVLLIDQIGILAELYGFADSCFVGGSFGRSVHSVLEPLAMGKPTWIGPKHTTSREAIEFQTLPVDSNLNAITCVDDEAAIQKLLEKIEKLDLVQVEKRIKDLILQKSGASLRILTWLKTNTLL